MTKNSNQGGSCHKVTLKLHLFYSHATQDFAKKSPSPRLISFHVFHLWVEFNNLYEESKDNTANINGKSTSAEDPHTRTHTHTHTHRQKKCPIHFTLSPFSMSMRSHAATCCACCRKTFSCTSSSRLHWKVKKKKKSNLKTIGTQYHHCNKQTAIFFPFLSCNCTKKCWLKESVERSLLPWAIFLIFTQNRPWKSEDHLCMLFFIEMSKERLEKSERTPPVSWRPWALAYSRDRPYNFSCLSALSKNGRFRRIWGVIWRVKAFRDQQCQFLTRNKSLSSEHESNCSLTSECVRTDSILPRGASLEHGRCKQSMFSLSIFGILVERLSF